MVKNNNENCQYLFIDAKNVVNYPNKSIRDYFVKCDRPFVTLDEIFDYYDIPVKYRYFIVKINPIFSKFECQEYFTKIPFDYTGYTRFKKDDNCKVIRGRAIINNITNFVEFSTSIDYKSYDDVVLFAFGLIDDELLQKYKYVVAKICDISFDYDNISVLNKYRKIMKK